MDWSIILPIFSAFIAAVGVVIYLLSKRFKSGALPRNNPEMTRMASGKENTYLVVPDFGIVGKMVSEAYSTGGDMMNTFWSSVGDLSGKKYHLPMNLPQFCFSMEAQRLNQACGTQKYLKFILPYKEETELVFLRPYIKHIHELESKLVRMEKIHNERIAEMERMLTESGALDFVYRMQKMAPQKPSVPTILAPTEPTPPVNKTENEVG